MANYPIIGNRRVLKIYKGSWNGTPIPVLNMYVKRNNTTIIPLLNECNHPLYEPIAIWQTDCTSCQIAIGCAVCGEIIRSYKKYDSSDIDYNFGGIACVDGIHEYHCVQIEAPDGKIHEVKCNHKHNAAEVEAHSYKDGVCTVCNTHCTHPADQCHYYSYQAPTCIAFGWNDHFDCSCGYSTCQYIAPLKHAYQQVGGEDATCGKDGYISYECSKCNDQYDEPISATGLHTWSNGTCSVCQATHDCTDDDVKETSRIDATCTTDGSINYKCDVCKKTTSTTIKAPGVHSYVDGKCACGAECNHLIRNKVDAVAATCTTAGNTEGERCATCNMITKGVETIPALYHESGEITWTGDGISECWTATLHCSRCTETLDGTVKVSSSVVEPTCERDGSYRHEASFPVGNYWKKVATDYCYGHITQAPGHSEIQVDYKPATCTQTGNYSGTKCSRCGNILSGCGTIPKTEHTYGDWTSTTLPTCTSEGTETGTCTCGATSTRTVEKIPHEARSSYDFDANDHFYTCKHCGTEITGTRLRHILKGEGALKKCICGYTGQGTLA